MLRLAARAPRLRAPVTSTLGRTLNNDRASSHRSLEHARLPHVARLAVTVTALRGITQRKVAARHIGRSRALARLPSSAPARSSRSSVVVGASRQRAAPRSQFVGAPPAVRLVRSGTAMQAAQ